MDYKLSFSVNLYDDEGDCYEECINLHLDNGIIIQFRDIDAYDNFHEKMKSMRTEIVESL